MNHHNLSLYTYEQKVLHSTIFKTDLDVLLHMFFVPGNGLIGLRMNYANGNMAHPYSNTNVTFDKSVLEEKTRAHRADVNGALISAFRRISSAPMTKFSDSEVMGHIGIDDNDIDDLLMTEPTDLSSTTVQDFWDQLALSYPLHNNSHAVEMCSPPGVPYIFQIEPYFSTIDAPAEVRYRRLPIVKFFLGEPFDHEMHELVCNICIAIIAHEASLMSKDYRPNRHTAISEFAQFYNWFSKLEEK